MQVTQIIDDLRQQADPQVAAHAMRFFKTGPGEYGEGDQFLGLRVPQLRQAVRKYREVPLELGCELLQSEWHEVRLFALLLMVEQYKRGDLIAREAIYQAYLEHLDWINNWDLVDSSAHHILGHYLFERPRELLDQLIQSQDLWRRRVAIMTTFYFIKQNDFADTLRLAERVLDDPEDLMHKASGWMLREVGKRDQNLALSFLDQHYHDMPRTMLRYAIEKYPQPLRQDYLKGRR